MNLCAYLKKFCYRTNITDSSNLEQFDTTRKVDEKVNKLSYSKAKTRSKSFFEKIKIKIKWSLRPLRNVISGSNLYQRLYILGWVLFLLDILFAFIIYAPFTLGILVLITSGLTLIKYRKEISEWITPAKFLRILSIPLIIIFGEYLVLQYYPIPIWINISVGYVNSFGWLNFISLIGIIIFSLGFAIETYLIWARGSKFINITLSILGAISSFLSLYFARWIIVYLVGLEPATFSRSVVLFSIPFGILSWIFFSIVVLSAIYFITVSIQIFSLAPPFNILFRSQITNSSWYRFLLRKPVETNWENRVKKAWIEFFFFKGGRALGAGLLSLSLYVIMQTISIWFTISLSFWINIAENIIVYADYRPMEKISECNNLQKDEWGLLVGYQKINVAKPEKLGGYIFTTKSCNFDRDISIQ